MNTQLVEVRPCSGVTRVSAEVVAKLVGRSVSSVPGVARLAPWSRAQTLTRLSRRIFGQAMREFGVNVEAGLEECLVELRIVADYGASLPAIAFEIRERVVQEVAAVTGLNARIIDIEIVDLEFAPTHDAVRVR